MLSRPFLVALLWTDNPDKNNGKREIAQIEFCAYPLGKFEPLKDSQGISTIEPIVNLKVTKISAYDHGLSGRAIYAVDK